MRFLILGPLEITDNDLALSVGRPQQRALLATLLLRANTVVSRERLIWELWQDDPPETAANALQVNISHLRKALGNDRIVTRAPGYRIEVVRPELDLYEFEDLLDAGRTELEANNPEAAAENLRAAVALRRGPILAEFTAESFAPGAIARIKELQLVAMELSTAADLALGRHAQAATDLEQLVQDYPLREPFREQLMLALYRSGRQAEALAVYRDARRVLVDELGIEPSVALQRLEQAILRQDASLELAGPSHETTSSATAEAAVDHARDIWAPRRSLMLAADHDESSLNTMLDVARNLATHTQRELILVSLVADADALADEMSRLGARAEALENRNVPIRAAAFRSTQAGHDLVRLASEQDVDLMLLAASDELLSTGQIGGQLRVLLEAAPCDVCLIVDQDRIVPAGRSVIVPFGGAEHDWAAVELGAWLAHASDVPLTLLGAAANRDDDQNDASRLLAHASLATQRVLRVDTRPLIVERGDEAVVAAARDASLLVNRSSTGSTTTPPTGTRPGSIGTHSRCRRRGRRPPNAAPASSTSEGPENRKPSGPGGLRGTSASTERHPLRV